jgi:hypothetical protein
MKVGDKVKVISTYVTSFPRFCEDPCTDEYCTPHRMIGAVGTVEVVGREYNLITFPESAWSKGMTESAYSYGNLWYRPCELEVLG